MKKFILGIIIFICTILPAFAVTQSVKELRIQNSNLIVFRDGVKFVTLTTDGNITSENIDRNPWPLSGYNIAYSILYSQGNLFLIKKQTNDSTSGNNRYFVCDLNKKNPSLVNIRLILRLRGFSDGWGITQPIDFLVKNKKLYLTTLLPSGEEYGTQQKYYNEFKERLLKKGYIFLYKAENWDPPQDVYGLEIKSLNTVYMNNF